MLHKTHSSTLIAEGTKSQGVLVFTSEAQILGLVEGEVKLETTESLEVGRTGWILGNIEAVGPVHIEGRVCGDIVSENKISISSHGSVEGTLTAPRIEIAPGARMEGEIKTVTDKAHKKSFKKAA